MAGNGISASTKAAAEQAVINAAADAGLSAYDTAYVLAIVQQESGFNPNAYNTSNIINYGDKLR